MVTQNLIKTKARFCFVFLMNVLVVLELVPVARDLIHIRGVHTGFYLALNKHGEVYTTVSHWRFNYVFQLQ